MICKMCEKELPKELPKVQDNASNCECGNYSIWQQNNAIATETISNGNLYLVYLVNYKEAFVYSAFNKTYLLKFEMLELTKELAQSWFNKLKILKTFQ